MIVVLLYRKWHSILPHPSERRVRTDS